MSDAWGGHQAAVYVAINNVGELQESLSAAIDAAERAIGATVEATGQSQMESAANALGALNGIKDRIQEIFGMSNMALEELRRYLNGF